MLIPMNGTLHSNRSSHATFGSFILYLESNTQIQRHKLTLCACRLTVRLSSTDVEELKKSRMIMIKQTIFDLYKSLLNKKY